MRCYKYSIFPFRFSEYGLSDLKSSFFLYFKSIWISLRLAFTIIWLVLFSSSVSFTRLFFFTEKSKCLCFRVFSNFENLKELGLIDAFRDSPSGDLTEELHSIFINSNLTSLKILHLEENKIEQFDNPKVFCGLNSLSHLYLGNNKLRSFSLDIRCLPNLRYLNLEGNEIKDFSKSELSVFDSFVAEKGSLQLLINSEFLNCHCLSNLNSWIRSTNVIVNDKVNIDCTCTEIGLKLGDFSVHHWKDHYVSNRSNSVQNPNQVDKVHLATHILVVCISCFLFIILAILSLRYSLELCKHTRIQTDKIHYKVIRNSIDVSEIHV